MSDYLNHRDELAADWNRLQAAVNDKHQELKAVQEHLRKLRAVDARLEPLVEALLDLVGEGVVNYTYPEGLLSRHGVNSTK